MRFGQHPERWIPVLSKHALSWRYSVLLGTEASTSFEIFSSGGAPVGGGGNAACASAREGKSRIKASFCF